MPNGFSYEDIKRIVEGYGWKLLSSFYPHRYTPLLFQCPKGHKVERTYDTFTIGRKAGKACRTCYYDQLRQKSIKNITVQFLEAGYTVHSIEYDKKNNTTAIVTCPNGHKNIPVRHSVLLQGLKEGKKPCRICKVEGQTGEKSHYYKPHLTPEQRDRSERGFRGPGYLRWKKDVKTRDNFTCQCCSIKNDELKAAKDRGESKTKLMAHHIKDHQHHPKLGLELDNGITLCQRCHTAFHQWVGWGKRTDEKLLNRFMKLYKDNKNNS